MNRIFTYSEALYSKSILIIGIFFLAISAGYSQEKEVTGTVLDETGTGLPGVTLKVKGSNEGTITDANGEFTLSVDQGATLVASFVGYESKELTVRGQSSLRISLEPDLQELSEVVVIGYGSAEKDDLSASIVSVTSADFEQQPLSRTEDALLGRSAGVQVLRNSGAPGADIKIRVRGLNSINGSNDPLIVVDGIIGGDLSTINPNDIESFDILKDASATAIYGSRGANGVILIKTKQGKSGKPRIEANYFASVSTVPKTIDLITPQQFADLVNEGISDPADQISVIDGGVDYQDLYFQNALTNNLQLSASGKSGLISYFISGNYVDQEGIVFNSDYNRLSLRSNLKAELSDKFTVGLNLFGSREKSFNLIEGGTSTDARGGILGLLSFDPTLPVKDENGNYTKSSIYGTNIVNPYAVRAERFGDRIENTTRANLELSYDIIDNLNFTVLAGGIISNTSNEVYQGIPAGSNDVQPPAASFNSNQMNTYQLSNILSWSETINKNSFNVTGVFEIQGIESKNRGFSAVDYDIGGIRDGFNLAELSGAQLISANISPSKLNSYLLRTQYNYDKRLYFTGAIRLDQTSRFRKENRTGIFPSASLAYRLNPSGGTKVRLGYGVTGNQDVSPFSTYQRFVTGVNAPFTGTSLTTGIALGGPVDEDLTWETTNQLNVGVDFEFLEGRINASVDVYRKNTTDLLIRLPQPLTIGGGSLLTNAGEIQNTGVDLNLRSIILDKGGFKWNANINYSYVENEMVSLAGLENIFQTINPLGTALNAFIIEEGEPIGNFYGAEFLGTWKTGEDDDQVAGSAKYLLDENDEVVQEIIGNGIPTTTWGLNQIFTYRNFDLNLLLRGVHGFDVMNVTRATLELQTSASTVPTSPVYQNRWTPENQNEIPASGTNLINSTRYIEDGSFIRLANVTLGYKVPVSKGGTSIRLYVSGQNLFTLTGYKGYDPEVSSTTSNSDGNVDTRPSVDQGAYPNPRTFTIGVNIGF